MDKPMEVGAYLATTNALNDMVAVSQQQAASTTELSVEMYALKASLDVQNAAALALIQSAMGIGQNVDYYA
jgi:hypothetical protein